MLIMRLTINIDDELGAKIAEHADKMHISRSAFVSACCATKMNVYFNAVTQDEIIDRLVEEAENVEADAVRYLQAQQLKSNKQE